MMPDNNPFLEGYKSVILGKRDACPYEEGSTEYERWCQGFGGKPEIKLAKKPVNTPVIEGRRPYVEGYKSAILGGRDACPYADGTPDYERWCKGFRGWTGSAAAKKPITIPVLEGRRPYVEGYKSAIAVPKRRDAAACPYEEGTSEYERWWKGFRWWVAAKNTAGQWAHR